MKEFEEQFPSLKNFNFVIDNRIPTVWIMKYCLDKQKVKEAIEKICKVAPDYECDCKEILLRELGL